jgi:SAM-dependent methyltransferase
MAGRRDLKLTGVDAAPALPRAPKGMRLIAGAAAERLPFPDARFDAIVSQFGFEYSDLPLAAVEAGRVLRPGGLIRMIVHHRDGPILPHNLARREALLWVIGESGLIGRARTFAAARQVAQLPIPEAFADAPRLAYARFPSATAGAELAEAVRRTLEMSRGRPAGEVNEVLAALEQRALAEIVRVDSLERAACDESRIKALVDLLEGAGVVMDAPKPLVANGVSAPFAWLVNGRKYAA